MGLFLGCVADAMFRHVHWATARVLQQNGCDVVIPRAQGCCGAIHYHSGASEPTLRLIKQNSTAFDIQQLDAIVVNVAGCGSMLKDFGHIAHELHSGDTAQAEAFVSKIRDVSEFLCELGFQEPSGRIEATVAYQDACHLQHAQRIKDQPRRLLSAIPGIRLKEIAEAELCCGAAGSYNLTQPEMADRLGERKVGHLLNVQPDLIVSGNAGVRCSCRRS